MNVIIIIIIIIIVLLFTVWNYIATTDTKNWNPSKEVREPTSVTAIHSSVYSHIDCVTEGTIFDAVFFHSRLFSSNILYAFFRCYSHPSS
jgi:formate hydrogenlyase subunit 3/multisubunit Na+/H+ antiporter MnhD subunit